MSSKHGYGPYKPNVQELAQGIFDLFTEEEKSVMRLGILPWRVMAKFDTALDQKLRETLTVEPHHKVNTAAWLREDGSKVEFHIPSVKLEITKDVVGAIYELGDLVL